MSAKQVVLITGISSGIGEATAKALARIGYVVFGGQRSVFAAAQMQGITVFPMDVRSDTSVRRGIDFVLEKAGGIDVVINNAGYALEGAVEETSLDEANALFETNFFGAARVIQAVLPILRRQRSGQIVNVSSAVGLFAVPFWGFYSASKFALEGYTEALRHEVRPFNIRVSLVEPGFTRTDLIHHGRNAKNVLAEYEPWKKEGLAAIARYTRQAPSAASVADQIVRIVTSRSDKLRHIVGGDARLITRLRRFLPQAVFEAIVRRRFHLEAAMRGPRFERVKDNDS